MLLTEYSEMMNKLKNKNEHNSEKEKKYQKTFHEMRMICKRKQNNTEQVNNIKEWREVWVAQK